MKGLILHLLKNDIQRQRYLIGVYLLLASVGMLAGCSVRLLEVLLVIKMFAVSGMGIVGVVITFRAMQADSLVGSEGYWMTLPISRTTLFLTKAILVIGFLLSLFLATIMVGWIRFGFDLTLIFLGLVEKGWIAFSILSLAAIVGGVTRNMGQAIGTVGGGVGFFVIWMLFLDRLGQTGNPYSTGLIVMLLCFSGFGAAWLVCALTRRMKLGVGIAVGTILISSGVTRFNPFVLVDLATPSNKAELKIVEFDEKDIRNERIKGRQRLWGRYHLEGLKTNEVAGLWSLQSELKLPKTGSWTHGIMNSSAYHFGRNRNGFEMLEQYNGRDLTRVVRGFYTEDTLFFGRSPNSSIGGMNLKKGRESLGNAKEPGSFFVEFDLGIMEVNRVLNAPVVQSFHSIRPGLGFEIRKVAKNENGLTIEVVEQNADLLLSRDSVNAVQHSSTGHIMVVFHDPESGEVYFSNQGHWGHTFSDQVRNTSSRNKTINIERSMLRSALLDVSIDDWLKRLRVHVYLPLKTGNYWSLLEKEDFLFKSNGGEGLQRSRQFKLADDWPGKESPQAAKWLRKEKLAILFARNDEGYKEVEKQLSAVAADEVGLILDLLPLPETLYERMIEPVLLKHLTETHKDQVVEILERCPNLIGVIRKKGWQRDAAPKIAGFASKRERLLAADMVALWAWNAKPEQFEDLSWHVLRSKGAYHGMLDALAALKGFPYEETLAELWRRRQAGLNSRDEIAPFMAGLGDQNALLQFGVQLRNERWNIKQKEHFLELVRPLASGEKDLKGVEHWVLAETRKINLEGVGKP
ncbi:hypothetical protein N9B94_01020 [Verrucomicrobia bacterium]|nr:hypothetical protein [Verrucomicrobiota bacterium]